MRCILPLSFATLLIFFCTVDRIIGGPLPNDETNYEPVNSTQDHPSGDQPFRKFLRKSFKAYFRMYILTMFVIST